jgi:predicted Zn-dependent protease
MVFGDDPRQGFFTENTFNHPNLKFRFVFPKGWKVQNLPASVTGVSTLCGSRAANSTGGAAPTAKDAADATAAWRGRARVSSWMPSSSRACAASASCAMS